MEVLVMAQFTDIYRGKRVLVTGHTGFKGSWLALWLSEMGAEVIGISLPPERQPSHWDLLSPPIEEYRLDIRELPSLQNAVAEAKPTIVFHLAAQPLVRRSYRAPIETWSTNVMGTVHLLETCRLSPDVRAIVVITTDKCYENREWLRGYRENDLLGGHDPYSASKAGTELVVASYRCSFFNDSDAPLIASVRAGNVIGGGDFSEDRLIPDLVRSLERKQSLEIRSPNATRPWQHVLDSLSGYLLLGQKLLMGDESFAEAWNFGPEPKDNRTVTDMLDKLNQHWGTLRWHVTAEPQPHEATLLYLDSTKARNQLGWQPVWGIDSSLAHTAAWFRAWIETGQIISRQQLADYVNAAAKANIPWAQS